MSSTIRLNKYLAEHTGISRRAADLAIERGKVRLNGAVAGLGARVQPGDKVTLDGRAVEPRAGAVTIALYKPVGYLSSRRSQGGDPTVYNLLPAELRALKTAGRLDRDSSGLMILSSNGDLIQKLTHPRHEKVKVYEITLDKPLEPLHQQMISDFGVDLADGKSRLFLEKLRSSSGNNWRVTMHEGRNRQIRRTFAALGYTVTKLHRVQLGNYSLDNLKPGQWRKITK
ncbi:MAG: pseudouridine synthase [Candidatus Nomurabacteria bacterium]|jgi:23S rRNA pseudouridine2605 synthase|nr:pseudouridine synthase [Candidatus Nomurabacteria bacterium]